MTLGYASASGNPQRDRDLALARAQRLAELLEQFGIDDDRLDAKGRGSTAPLADTPPASPRNERVSIVLMRRAAPQ